MFPVLGACDHRREARMRCESTKPLGRGQARRFFLRNGMQATVRHAAMKLSSSRACHRPIRTGRGRDRSGVVARGNNLIAEASHAIHLRRVLDYRVPGVLDKKAEIKMARRSISLNPIAGPVA